MPIYSANFSANTLAIKIKGYKIDICLSPLSQ